MKLKVRQLMLVGKTKVEIQNVEIAAASGDVLVKNRYSLISPGTELALFTGTHIGFSDPEIAWARYPLRPGYSSVGRIAGVGSEVEGFSEGEEVLHFQPHADYALVNPRKDLLFKLPPGLDAQKALFARFGQIAYTAAAASLKKEGYVLVLGGGIVGNLCAQLFQARQGRRTIIADIAPSRAALALRCGVGAAICAPAENMGEALLAETGQEGVSTVVEATGVPELVTAALKLVNRLGEVILLGSARGAVTIDVYKHIHRKALNVIGAHESRYPPFAGPGDSASQSFFGNDVLGMLAAGTIKTDGFLTDTVSPSRVAEAYAMLLNDRDRHLGILIDWK